MQEDFETIINGSQGGQVEWVYQSSSEDLAETAAAAAIALLSPLARPTMALSGGRIAPKFYQALRSVSGNAKTVLQRTHYFWADERCVEPDSEESNFLCAKENLFDPLGVSSDQIHRIQGELGPDQGAQQARADLQKVFGSGVDPVDSSQAPALDLVILGMGEDGHVASLFPKHLAAANDQPVSTFYGIEDSPKPPPQRVTLSYPMLIAASNVWALIPGEGKKTAVLEALDQVSNPIGKLISMRETVRIYSDFRLSK